MKPGLGMVDLLGKWDFWDELTGSVGRAREDLIPVQRGSRVLVIERSAERFVVSVLTALGHGADVVLGDAGWPRAVRDEVVSLMQPDWVGSLIPGAEGERREGAGEGPWAEYREAGGAPLLAIPTGGTSGRLRFAMHTTDTLTAAANGFNAGLGIARNQSLCCLPLHHVSGFMQVWRALVSNGRVRFFHSREAREVLTGLDEAGSWVLSLVPTQLVRWLEEKDEGILETLQKLRAVVVGGARVSPDLLREARRRGLPLAVAYGMTETAAAATLLTPEDFLAGGSGVGHPLPHVKVFMRDSSGLPARVGRRRRIVVQASSLCLGLAPGGRHPDGDGYLTGDAGYLDGKGRLHVEGRLDRVVNTGGEKVQPARIEDLLMESGLVDDVLVFGEPELEWGEILVAMVVTSGGDGEVGRLKDWLQPRVNGFEVPKRWQVVKKIPRTPAGKPDWTQIRGTDEV